MEKVGRFLDKIIAYLGYVGIAMGAISIFIMVIMISINVAMRYFFGKSFIFIEEYSGYLLGIIVYMGLAYTARKGEHINVDLATRHLFKRMKDCFEIKTLSIALILMCVYFWYAWDFFKENLRVGTRGITVMNTPLWIPQSFLWMGLSFFILEILTLIIKKIVSFRWVATQWKGLYC